MGDASTIQVPLGTNMVVRARTDRPLKDGIRLRAPAQADDRSATVPNVPVVLAPDGRHFSIALNNVVRPHEFVLEFNDLDNVKGRRRLRIQPVDDRPPEVLDMELDVVLRKPRFKAEPGRSVGLGADGFLITPDALLPFKGTIRDDYGLTKAAWIGEVEQVEFELVGSAATDNKDKLPTFVLQGTTQARAPPCWPAISFPCPAWLARNCCAANWTMLTRLFRADFAQKRSEGEEQDSARRVSACRWSEAQSMSCRSMPLSRRSKITPRSSVAGPKAQAEQKPYTSEKRARLRPLLKEHLHQGRGRL